jgi:hypothetical protein
LPGIENGGRNREGDRHEERDGERQKASKTQKKAREIGRGSKQKEKRK